MKFGMYSIRDIKSGFLAPVCEVSAAVAQRNFEHAVLRNEDSLFFSHPEDYCLFVVGSFDSDSGKVKSCVPEEVISASEVMRKAWNRGEVNGNEGK